MTIVVPTLDASGWLTGVAEKADKLMTYFLICDYSQSNVHQGSIKSLPFLIQKRSNNLFYLREDVSSALVSLFNNYFDKTEANVDIDDKTTADKEARFDLRISIIIVHEGVRYSLGRLLTIVNTNITKVIEI